MKKVIKLSLIIMALLLFSGCSKTEVLECSLAKEEDIMTMNQDVFVTFKGIVATKLEMDFTFVLKDDYISYIDSVKENLEENLKEDGVKLTSTVTNNTININMLYDIKNMTEEQKEALELDDIYGTLKDTKEAFIKEGYVCK